MHAAFDTDASKGRVPACCEVRQYIKWDKRYHVWQSGTPNRAFPWWSKYLGFDRWLEDRDKRDKRYGHRSGKHFDPKSEVRDEYRTVYPGQKRGKRDQQNGNVYYGSDHPAGGGTVAMIGTWNFQLKVIDTCHGGKVKASSSIITIKWG